jgi:hypothetical protein
MNRQPDYKIIQYKFDKLMSEVERFPVFTKNQVFVDTTDEIMNRHKICFETYIAVRVKAEKEIIYHPPRQSFWDYVLRRKPKSYAVKVIAKDVLINPPQINHPVVQLYEIIESQIIKVK